MCSIHSRSQYLTSSPLPPQVLIWKVLVSVHLYDCYKKTWSKVSDIRNSRDSPAVVVSTFENKHELFVLGGMGAGTSVESCELL